MSISVAQLMYHAQKIIHLILIVPNFINLLIIQNFISMVFTDTMKMQRSCWHCVNNSTLWVRTIYNRIDSTVYMYVATPFSENASRLVFCGDVFLYSVCVQQSTYSFFFFFCSGEGDLFLFFFPLQKKKALELNMQKNKLVHNCIFPSHTKCKNPGSSKTTILSFCTLAP